MSVHSFYQTQLWVLASFCISALLLERWIDRRKAAAFTKGGASTPGDSVQKHSRQPSIKLSNTRSSKAARSLAWSYLTVYAVVMGADWLQGPYVYSLYHDQYKFPERIVAVLFVTGFTSAGLTGPLVGVWADQHGRRRLCLAFCAAYAAACVCTLFGSLPILLLGRVLGGLSTSILFSCFESHLISASNAAGLSSSELSSIMGKASLINGFVASAMGVVSNELVTLTGTFTAPFIASGVLLAIAYFLIRGLWQENYGVGGSATAGTSVDLFQIARLKEAWTIVQREPSLLALGLTQTCFEGSMYLFVFLWVPSMQSAFPPSTPQSPLPLGIIFSSFMFSMMIGSLIYTTVASHSNPRTTDASPVLHAKLSSLVCLAGGIALAVSVKADQAHTRFWSFCAFEACVGMYYPVQGMLRGSMIADDHRATLSSLFRVPLNIFVIFTLLSGVESARSIVLAGCTVALMVASVTTGLVIVKRATNLTNTPTS